MTHWDISSETDSDYGTLVQPLIVTVGYCVSHCRWQWDSSDNDVSISLFTDGDTDISSATDSHTGTLIQPLMATLGHNPATELRQALGTGNNNPNPLFF